MGTEHYITSAQLEVLKRAATRLHTENRMNGDEMRDMGHALRAIYDTCIEIEIPKAAS